MRAPEGKQRAKRRLIGCCIAIAAVIAAACAPVKPPPEPPPAPGWITTSPTLFPAFSTDIPDYVAKCDASAPVQIVVDAPPDTNVSINGAPFQGGQFSAEVTRAVGQSFVIVVQAPTGFTTHFVRCLPGDFPDWNAQRTGDTQAEWYVMSTPQTGGNPPNYPVIFDHDGVPVWWSNPLNNSFTTLLPNNDVAWTLNTGAGAEEHALDGHLVRTVKATVGGTDIHDVLLLPSGNYVVVGNVRVPADLSSCGGSAAGSLLDHVIQEIDPQTGLPVWTWDTFEHIPVSESDPQWQTQCANGDAYHWNSIEATPDGYLVSFRHLDAVYKIKKDVGQLDDKSIEWKLGGSEHDEGLPPHDTRLTPVNDLVFDGGSHFGGQHDARLLSDGTVTLHDNGSNLGRPPRAVRYQIDTTNKTATLQEQMTDPLVPSSNCCGDARKLPGGNWVMGWGGSGGDNRVVTEMTADGTRAFLLQFPKGVLYRATPVLFGQLSRGDLRAGMDAQFGTPAVGTTSAGATPNTAATSGPAPQPPNPLVNLP
jgi:Arylsulfotransferase (ASST)